MQKVLKIPPGTVATVNGSRVTLDFFCEQEAVAFLEWFKWLDSPESTNTKMVVRKPDIQKH